MRRKSMENTFAKMKPELRAVYERIHRRELARREVLFKQHPTYLVNEIPIGYGHHVPTLFIRSWLRHRHCFAYRHDGRYRFPAFQFANGVPKAVIARVLELLYPMEGWVVIYWFVATNVWLDEDATPVGVLDTDPHAVLIAASHANDAISD